MIDYAYKDLFLKDSVKKRIDITYTEGGITKTISNSDLYSEDFTLTQSICSESELKFGCCEASSIKFKIGYSPSSLVGKELTVSIVLNNDNATRLQIGIFKVVEDVESADHYGREITAYDRMNDILNADVLSWYNAFWNSNVTKNITNFTTSFLTNLGIPWSTFNLANGNVTIQKTIEAEKLSGAEIITAIAEINGVFGHINPQGYFVFKRLEEIGEGLYPSTTLYPANDLYPLNAVDAHLTTSCYKDCQYSAYKTRSINGLIIRQDADDVGCVYPNDLGNNKYTIEGNFLVYGMNSSQLNTVASNLYNVIWNRPFRPSTITARGNLCIEVGDSIRCIGAHEIVDTYVLTRVCKGVQNLFDTYTSSSSEYIPYAPQTNSNQIRQIQGKTNKLIRTVDQTISRVESIEADYATSSEIIQTANKVSIKVSSTSAKVWDESNVTIHFRGYGDPTETMDGTSASTGQYYLDMSNGKLYQKNASGGWTYIRTLAQYAQTLSSAFTQKDNEISAKVSAVQGDTSQTCSWTLRSTGWSVKCNGSNVVTINSSGLTVEGEIKARSGTIGAGSNRVWHITADGTQSAIYSGKTTLDSDSTSGIYVGTDGIALGTTNEMFKVTRNGHILAKSGEIGGCSIVNGVLQVANANISGTISTAHLSADVITTGNLSSQSISATQITSGTIDTARLSADVITTSNFSAQNINANKITSGTVSTSRLDVNAIASQTVTAQNIATAMNSPTQGTITVGTCRSASFQYYNGVGYEALSLITISGHRVLGVS